MKIQISESPIYEYQQEYNTYLMIRKLLAFHLFSCVSKYVNIILLKKTSSHKNLTAYTRHRWRVITK